MILTADQKELVEAFRPLLTARHTPDDVRRLEHPRGTSHSDPLWAELCKGGWIGLVFDTDIGGGGGSLVDLGLLFREGGRALVPTTWLSTLHTAWLLLELGVRTSTVEQLVSGERLGTYGYAEAGAERDPRYIATRAVPADDRWHLHGTKLFVPNAATAEILVVAARVAAYGASGPVRFFLLERPAGADDVVDLEPHRTVGHDAQFAVHLRGAPAVDVAPEMEGAAAIQAWQRASDRALALHLMYMVGCFEAVVDMTVEHVTHRVVFGRPIGSFQKPQHMLADMEIALRGGRLAARRALVAVERGMDAARSLAVAKVWLGRALKESTVLAHQLFGGMGYVKEGDLHLYSRLAIAADAAYGWGPDHLETIAAGLDDARGRTRR